MTGLVQEAPSSGSPERGAAAPVIEVSSAALFGGATELVIRHAGECYRLRITKQNKLILNK